MYKPLAERPRMGQGSAPSAKLLKSTTERERAPDPLRRIVAVRAASGCGRSG